MASNTRTRETRDPSDARPEICDYEDSTYRTDFWTQERSYEDAAERIALKALLPPMGDRLIEIGAGFGRLVDLYAGYEQVVLLDYSRSMLREARAQWGDAAPSGRPRYTYVAADFYALPFVAGLFDTVTMIRVIHHAQDAARVLQGISDITAPGGSFVLEFANKRNLKAIARWILRKQSWNPHDLPPYEFADLNFDFHPQWIQRRLHEASFSIKTQRTVSHLRLDLLKRLVPTPIMARLDGLLQPTGRWWQFTPSVFVLNQAPQTKPAAQADTFFRCPACGDVRLSPSPDRLACHSCQRSWPIRDGLYDFKEPL